MDNLLIDFLKIYTKIKNIIFFFLFKIESWLKKHGARDQHRPWQDQKSRHYGGLSYFPTDNNNNGGNENKESKVENEQGKNYSID